MRKLTLQFGGIKEMLTKEQMRKINGGDEYSCGWTTANGSVNYASAICGTSVSPCECQDTYDRSCSYDPNCKDVDCGCKN